MKFRVRCHILFGLLSLLQFGCTWGKGLEKDQALLLQVKVENLIEKILRVIQDYYNQIRTELKCIPDDVPDTIIDTLKSSIDCVDQNERNYDNGRISSNMHKKLFLRCFSDAKKEVEETIMKINPQLDYCPENMTEKTYQINVSTTFTKTFHINIKNGLEVIRKKVHLGNEKQVYVFNQGEEISDKQNRTSSSNGSLHTSANGHGNALHPHEHGDLGNDYGNGNDNFLNEDGFGREPDSQVDDYVDYDEGIDQNGDVNGINVDEYLYSKEHHGKGHASKKQYGGIDEFFKDDDFVPNSDHQVSNSNVPGEEHQNGNEDVNYENGLESTENHAKELQSQAHVMSTTNSKHQGTGHFLKENHGNGSQLEGNREENHKIHKEHHDKGHDSKKDNGKGHDSKDHHNNDQNLKEHHDQGHYSREHNDNGHSLKEHHTTGPQSEDNIADHNSKEHQGKGNHGTNKATFETKSTTLFPGEENIALSTENASDQDYYTDQDVELEDADYENEYYDTTQKEKDFMQTDSPDEAEDIDENLEMIPTTNYRRRIQIKPKNHFKLKSKKPQISERHKIKLPKTSPTQIVQQQTTPRHRAVSSLSQSFSESDF